MSISTGEGGPSAPRLGVGEVINKAVPVGRRNIRPLALLALMWVALPEAVIGLLTMNASTAAQSTSTAASLLAVIFSGAATHLVTRDLQGLPVALREAQQVGVKLFLPILGISILAAIGVGLGILLFVVPGIILALMWSVVVSVRVGEGPGVMASFGRSRALTKGNRWPIFLVFLVTIIPIIAILAVAALFTAAVGAASPFAVGVISPLASAAAAVLYAVIAPTIYVRLRELREGGGPSQLAAVFD